ncbi:hypothetical protein SETIT_2G218900v2 [Setaria italica]|uniref:Secreted protein n=2 Tax=Setaria TaxID=4554 RepID=A0A368Q1Y1_SETIT|nr:hypothetical protein SETIT_2G218900v2 [Setaria italica]TKW33350.1 hypothetical protein SEVIR_2G228400v2 [Setaria viridis]
MTRGWGCSCGGSTILVVAFVSTRELIDSSACSVWEIICVFHGHTGKMRSCRRKKERTVLRSSAVLHHPFDVPFPDHTRIGKQILLSFFLMCCLSNGASIDFFCLRMKKATSLLVMAR